MKSARPLVWILALALALSLLLVFAIMPRAGVNAPVAPQAHWCECVHYVANRFALNLLDGPFFGGAAQMGPFLEAHGFRHTATPTIGAIILFQPWFGSGIDTFYGHAGVVTHIDTLQDGSGWNLTVRGARQGHATWTEHGCTNVSDMGHIIVRRNSESVSFYLTGPVPGQLQVIEQLHLSTAAAQVGEQVSAHFVVQNTGEQPLIVQDLTAGGRLGYSWDAEVLADFPLAQNVTLHPGQTYHYEAAQILSIPGSYFAEPVARIDGAWNTIPAANRVTYRVEAPPPPVLPTATTPPPEPPPPPEVPPPTPSIMEQADTHAPLPQLVTAWTQPQYLGEGSYMFYAQAGVGIRLYLDDTLVIDGLTPQDDYRAAQFVHGGFHEVRVELYANNDGSQATYSWQWQGG